MSWRTWFLNWWPWRQKQRFGTPDVAVADEDVTSLRKRLGRFWKKWLGDEGERIAREYLQRLGYVIVTRQFRNQWGEIDLIAIDGDWVVFVEVKTRRSLAAGSPEAAVTKQKQIKLTRLALAFLKRRKLLNRRARFDVVAIVYGDKGSPEVRYYKNAFPAADI